MRQVPDNNARNSFKKKSNAGANPKQSFSLSLHDCAVGDLFFGYVVQINSKSVVVSLPGGLTGTIEVNELSDAFNNLTSTGETSHNVSLF